VGEPPIIKQPGSRNLSQFHPENDPPHVLGLQTLEALDRHVLHQSEHPTVLRYWQHHGFEGKYIMGKSLENLWFYSKYI
jgi:hypothetical protein